MSNDDSFSASVGVSKIIVDLSSINLPGLKFIAKTLYEDKYAELGANPRKLEVSGILKENGADVISFGTVALKINEKISHYLTVPPSAPFKCKDDDKVRIRKLSEWKQELQDLEEEERNDEYYVIEVNESGEFNDFLSSN